MRKFIFSILLLSLIGIGWAQKKKTSSTNLEKQRINLLQEISKTEKQLETLSKTKTTSIEALKVLQRKMDARNKLVNTLDRQVASIDNNIGKTNEQILALQAELNQLKKHYAELVRFSYKNRTAQNFVLFLFSAKSFNDANRRLSYVKQYRNYRAKQAKKIELANLKLEKTIDYLKVKKEDKASTLLAQRKQNAALEKETIQQNKMVEKLKGQEAVLKKQLAAKRKTALELNNAIANAIQREVEEARKRAIAEQLAKQKAAEEKKFKEEQQALLEKRKAEASARERERIERMEKENKRIAEEKARQEEEEKQARERERIAEEERNKRIEQERALALEKKKAENEAKRLEELKREREEEERKAKQLAEEQRKKREAELALQRKAEEDRANKLAEEKKRQVELQKKLEIEKKKQREYERKLAREKKQRRKEREKLEAEKEANAKKGGEYLNPRYVPSEAEKEEAEKRKKELAERAKMQVNNNYTIALTEEERNLSSNFAANQGRLPWPVSSGYISDRFGKNKHPVFNVYTENYGIDIQTKKGAPAYAVFPGEVSSVIFIPGAGQTVLINHGSFYTVYSKLANVSVRKGQKIALKQVLGNVITDESGVTKVHFEIWRVGENGTPNKENPENWVRQP